VTTREQAEQGAQGTTARVAAVATLETGVRAPRIRVRPTTIALAVLFILLSLLFFVPLYWMILSSMRPQGEIFGTSINLLPTGLSLDNYVRLINTTPFVKWFWNSCVQSLGYATITVAMCATAGFAFARYQFRGRTIIFWSILLSQMLPFQLLIVPLFVEIVKLGLVETYVGAVVPLAAHPIGLLFMRQYMMGMSEEMLSAARVDGANEYRLFWSVALPNARPAIARCSSCSRSSIGTTCSGR
jgi:ABC-type glycerol-3-phosphate transport system permease component